MVYNLILSSGLTLITIIPSCGTTDKSATQTSYEEVTMKELFKRSLLFSTIVFLTVSAVSCSRPPSKDVIEKAVTNALVRVRGGEIKVYEVTVIDIGKAIRRENAMGRKITIWPVEVHTIYSYPFSPGKHVKSDTKNICYVRQRGDKWEAHFGGFPTD